MIVKFLRGAIRRTADAAKFTQQFAADLNQSPLIHDTLSVSGKGCRGENGGRWPGEKSYSPAGAVESRRRNHFASAAARSSA